MTTITDTTLTARQLGSDGSSGRTAVTGHSFD
jgi:hypothetical protein